MGDWNNSLCGCFSNFGTCLLAFFCPCVVLGQVAEETDTCGCFCAGASCFILPCVSWWLTAKTRGAVREKYDIQGGFCGDCCVTGWCTYCALAQMKTQLDVKMGETMERV